MLHSQALAGALASLAAPVAALAAPFPVVDVHVHTSPSRYGATADLLASNGVSRFVNLSGGAPGDGLEENLDAARELRGRVLVCANPQWEYIAQPDFGAQQAAMLERAFALGARCVKVSKALGLSVEDPSVPDRLLAVDDARLDPLWAAAGQLGMPVFIHTGDPAAFFEPLTPQNERWAELEVHPKWSFADPRFPRLEVLIAQRDRVLERHPKTTFIGVHFGCWPENLRYIQGALARYPNLYVDIAARIPEIGRRDTALLREIFTQFQDRILFGTDLGVGRGLMLGSTGREEPTVGDAFLFFADHYRFLETADAQIPHPTPIQGDWQVNAVNLPPEVLVKVYALNALRLLWRETGSSTLDAEALRDAPGAAEYFP